MKQLHLLAAAQRKKDADMEKRQHEEAIKAFKPLVPLTLGGKEGTWDFQGGAAPPALTPIKETTAEPPVAQTPPVTPPSDAGPSTSGSWTWSERGEGALLERSSPHPENVLHRGAAQR